MKHPVTKDDFTKRRSIYLRNESQYEYLANLPGEANIGRALNRAMDLIEQDYESLRGILPRDYEAFGNDLLHSLIRIFNDEVLKKAFGDIFGRIYEYFLMKFAMLGAHDNGEFFTPPSIVQTIVSVIEPDHGIVFDPACGSGGMFVQTSHFLEAHEKEVQKMVTFYGQEKNETTIRIAKMNLAVHGLEGNIKKGNTFYEDEHEMIRKADFVMANPPFNVDGVDAEKIKNDPRLPFGLPGVNNKGAVTNGNYLWISYFYSYLNTKGRAGFVMSSQASSAGHGEMTVRKKIIETDHVDVMIAIRSNFFYTRSVPCELWFFDKGKPKDKMGKVLMIDARNIHRKVTRKIYDFSPEQLKNIAAIVWLYRGQSDKYLELIGEYIKTLTSVCGQIQDKLSALNEGLQKVKSYLSQFAKALVNNEETHSEMKQEFHKAMREFTEILTLYEADNETLLKQEDEYQKSLDKDLPDTNAKQIKTWEAFDPVSEKMKGLMKQIELLAKLVTRASDRVKLLTTNHNRLNEEFDRKEILKLSKQFISPKVDSDEMTLLSDVLHHLKQVLYFHKQIHWLQTKFPEAKLQDVEGLVKLVDRKTIEKNDWSLTPGRYVGVVPPEEDDDFDFEEKLRDIHVELAGLNEEAAELAKKIQENFEELGI